jgi:hypothetical protein
MLKTRILSGKICSFVLALLFLLASGFLLHYPVAIAAEPDATAGSGNETQMGYWLGDGAPATDAAISPRGVAPR